MTTDAELRAKHREPMRRVERETDEVYFPCVRCGGEVCARSMSGCDWRDAFALQGGCGECGTWHELVRNYAGRRPTPKPATSLRDFLLSVGWGPLQEHCIEEDAE